MVNPRTTPGSPRTTPTTSLFPFVPLDRYCFAPCAEQLTEGECDCTRRIAREALPDRPCRVCGDTFTPEHSLNAVCWSCILNPPNANE